jgi:DNA-binding protein YbaB
MFDKMKALLDMQKKIQEIKRQLDATDFEIKSQDGRVTVVMNGSQQVQDVIIAEGADREGLQRSLKDTFNRAIKRSQEVAAQKMKEITGMALPPGM